MGVIKICKKGLPFIILIFAAKLIFAQKSSITCYSVNDGLAQSTIYTILQDKRGFLWFGTYGGGLCRFDGVNFKTYTEKDSLIDNKIYKLLEDSKGNIWVGSRKGLTVYDGIKFKEIKFTFQEKSVQVRDILEDENGAIWVATYGVGLLKIKNGDIVRYTTYDGLRSNYIYDIERVDKGELLIGTREGISYFDGKRFTRYDSQNEHLHNNIRDIIKRNNGDIWYGAFGGGVCNISDGEHNCIKLNELHNQNVMSILETQNGEVVWVATFGEGIYKITKDTTINYNFDNSDLSTNNIISLYEDNLGNVWAGTFLGGVCKISETAFYSFTRKDGLRDPSVENLYELKDGSILMTLMSGGVNEYTDGLIQNYRHSDKLKGLRVTSIYQDFEGFTWLSTDGDGVYKIKDNYFEKLNSINKKISSDQVFVVAQTKDSTMWFGTYGDGIIKYRGRETKTFKKEYERGLNSNQILDIVEDDKGNVWFATNGGGITMYNGKNFKTFDLGYLDFISIEKDIFGNLWFACNGGGVFKYDGEKFDQFSTKEGLISNNVNLIVFDNANNLWVGSEKGINKIIFELKDTLNKVEYLVNKIEHYNTEDGLVGIETNQGAVLKDKKGNLWFGTIKGVSKYNSKGDKFNLEPTIAQITSLKLSNEDTDWTLYADSIKNWSKLPINLKLEYNQNHLTFDFVGINLNVPHGVKYKYILEGFEEEWTETKRNFVSYSNIPSGTYTFKVLAQNEDGVWQQEPTLFQFEIDKPFWLKWWFIVISTLIIGIIVYIYIKQREKEIRRRNLELEKMVNDRTMELKKEKEHVEQINIEVEKKNEQILDSIQYAKKIQMAILPPDELVREKLPEFGILYEAKDIVSGDFYWMTEENDKVFFATVDCTGHGVPGAFMSIVGYRLLELIISGYNIQEPAHVLDELHMQVLETLHKQKGQAKDISDGMDIALCSWDKKTNTLKYSGAHNPLYLIRNGELIEYPSDARPIGMSMMKEFKQFNQHEIQLQKDDIVYIFTDGFADQFGGKNYRKYYYQTFQKFLLSISDESMEKQQELLKKEFYDWKGDYEQIDDVLVFGVRF